MKRLLKINLKIKLLIINIYLLEKECIFKISFLVVFFFHSCTCDIDYGNSVETLKLLNKF